VEFVHQPNSPFFRLDNSISTGWRWSMLNDSFMMLIISSSIRWSIFAKCRYFLILYSFIDADRKAVFPFIFASPSLRTSLVNYRIICRRELAPDRDVMRPIGEPKSVGCQFHIQGEICVLGRCSSVTWQPLGHLSITHRPESSLL
jgi:hypothetical protein